jgi:hypothetical protein
MRWLVIALGLLGAIGCNNVDHPPVLDPCDPERMKCGKAASAGGGEVGAGSGSGSGTGTGSGDAWTGDIIVFDDDTFWDGTHYDGLATVSAYGISSYYTSAEYDGNGFVLEDVAPASPNWFLAVPDDLELIPTLMPIFTDGSSGDVTLGVPDVVTVDEIFAAFTDSERSLTQVVLRIVDGSGNSIAGVRALDEPGAVYRDGTTWTSALGASTDDSGLILIPYVYLGELDRILYTVTLTGSIEEEVTVEVQRYAMTIADVPFY